jgi:hypothetical protein
VKSSRALSWVLLCLWGTWLMAWQGWLLRGHGAWVPDLGLIFLLALATRLRHEDLPWLALAMGVARASVAIEGAPAVLAASLALVALVRCARSVIEVRGPLATALCAGGLSLCSSAWFELARAARLQSGSASMDGLPGGALPEGAWSLAVATAIAAPLLGPLLVHLPGLRPLLRRHTWVVDGSSR